MPIARPHRRNRRRPAPGTPGGPIDGLTALFYVDKPTPDTIRLISYVVNNGSTPPGIQATELLPGTYTDTAGWWYYEGATLLPITQIDVAFNGQVQVTLAAPAGAAGTLFAAPFIPYLATKTGLQCGGIACPTEAP